MKAVARFNPLTRWFGRTLQAFVAAVFLLSCLATAAHLAMAAGEGCQAVEPSVRSCSPGTSLDLPPAVPGLALRLDSSPAPTLWVTLALAQVGVAQHQIAPLVTRSPPSLSA